MRHLCKRLRHKRGFTASPNARPLSHPAIIPFPFAGRLPPRIPRALSPDRRSAEQAVYQAARASRRWPHWFGGQLNAITNVSVPNHHQPYHRSPRT
ncbi:MAG: hypothetical protein AAFP02_18640, partial [Bacteroidota bacterium]